MKTARIHSRGYLAKSAWTTAIGLALIGCVPVATLTPTLVLEESNPPVLTATSQQVEHSLLAPSQTASDTPVPTITETSVPFTPTPSPSRGPRHTSQVSDTPETTETRALVPTPISTEAPDPINPQEATVTPIETAASVVTETAAPTERPTPTSAPTLRPTPTSPPESEEDDARQQVVDCGDSSGGRQKIRIENETGSQATLFLSGPEDYACAISPGIQKIYILSGTYEISGLVCGGEYYSMGTHVVNPTWYISLQCP